MIRQFKETDIEKIMDIWLNVNIEVHNFIDADYWKSNFEMVKRSMYNAEIYVYEDNNIILGFIGLIDNHIAGVFVGSNFRSQGTGKALIDYVKNIKNKITLNVYDKNSRAIDFYKREGFKVSAKNIDDDTGEREYEMLWKL